MSVTVYIGDELARYGFGQGHPFGPDRQQAFIDEFNARGLDKKVTLGSPASASESQLSTYHTQAYIDKVKTQSKFGTGYLDMGDTPAFIGIFEAGCTVVGTTLKAVDDIMTGKTRRAFIPIAGLHHARRDTAAGFCVFNDCGVAIEILRKEYGIKKVAYIDIDAHHGDGVFYDFESDPDLCYVDFHEDGKFLYPGTGRVDETGTGEARGTKLNIPMPVHATDELFLKLWDSAEQFVEKADPDFILLQCGADSIAGDPITHMMYSPKAHHHAAQRLSHLADRCCDGRLLAMGGGGYNRRNLAKGWCEVVSGLLGE